MDWLKNISSNIMIQGVVISAIIMFVVFSIGSILFLFKPSKNRNSIKYIYSFATGFILITAIIGQFVTARTKLFDSYKKNRFFSETSEIFFSLFIILISVLIGVIVALFIHKIFKKFSHHKKGEKEIHNHAHSLDHDYDLLMHGHSKLPGIIMLTIHRFPAGLAIGGLLYNWNNGGEKLSMLALIAFIIHIIPELFIVYFGLLDSGKSKKQTFLYSTLANLIIILGIFIGIGFGKIASYKFLFWFQPLIFIVVGTLIIWGVVLELIPEFIHHQDNTKTITIMSLIFIFGMALSLFIQFIHIH